MIGGLVSIITCFTVSVYVMKQMHDQYYHPVYNSYPATYNFEYDKTIQLHLNSNMPSYLLQRYGANPLETLRVVFFDYYNMKYVPAVYCSDYYADEIAAEQQSDSSTFYSDKYGFPGGDG